MANQKVFILSSLAILTLLLSFVISREVKSLPKASSEVSQVPVDEDLRGGQKVQEQAVSLITSEQGYSGDCNELSSTEQKNQCWYTRAQNQMDESFCTHISTFISNEYSRDGCFSLIANKKGDFKICENVSEQPSSFGSHFTKRDECYLLPISHDAYMMKGDSMEPNLFDHEYLVINEISYRFTEPARGEIVVFRYPENQKQFFIKRIIGLPGETVAVHNGIINVNNMSGESMVLDEASYLTVPTAGEVTVTLADDEYYVLGDNRGVSFDSRSSGPIRRDRIVGKAMFRVNILETPIYE